MLATLIADDEDALICDFAQTYHLYDYRTIPARRTAILAIGLPPDSRTMMRLAGLKVPLRDMLAAATLDGINMLLWQNTRDGRKNRNRPKSVLEKLNGFGKKNDVAGFATAEDFERAKQKILQGR